MKRLARGFSKLTLFVIVAAVTLLLWERYRLPPAPPPAPPAAQIEGQIDRILIEKAARRLTVYRGGEALKSYKVALGFEPVGDKDREGDGRTPEGVFRIDRRNPGSAYHLSLGLNYPQAEDVARASAGGYSPGGDIFIHGQPNAVGGLVTIPYDWTAGCIAVGDAEIEELWRITPMGTEVEIRP